MTKKFLILSLFALAFLPAWGAWRTSADSRAIDSSAFTYQGQLTDNGLNVNGNYDFTFKLFNAESGGSQVGATDFVGGVPVEDGVFTVSLDFGTTPFDGQQLWLEIEARESGQPAYTQLSPRQPLNATPYALFAGDVENYANVIVVAKSGGDFTDVQDALDSIVGASVDNRYLVYVAPGVYSGMVTMKQYVDIAGAGRHLTKITHTGSSGINTGTVICADDATLRSLTVENTGGASRAIPIYCNGDAPRLTDLYITSSGGISGNYGVYSRAAALTIEDVVIDVSVDATKYGVNLGTAAVITLRNVEINLSGTGTSYGVYFNNATAEMYDSLIKVTGNSSSAHGVYALNNIFLTAQNITVNVLNGTNVYGIFTTGSSSGMSILNSTITARNGSTATYALFGSGNNNTGATTLTVQGSQLFAQGGTDSPFSAGTSYTSFIGSSQLGGGSVAGAGTKTCAGVYNDNYTFFASTCP